MHVNAETPGFLLFSDQKSQISTFLRPEIPPRRDQNLIFSQLILYEYLAYEYMSVCIRTALVPALPPRQIDNTDRSLQLLPGALPRDSVRGRSCN